MGESDWPESDDGGGGHSIITPGGHGREREHEGVGGREAAGIGVSQAKERGRGP